MKIEDILNKNIDKLSKIASRNDQWEYEGHQMIITIDEEPGEVKKAWHEVISPDGEKMVASITPYNTERETLELWVDAGYPQREKNNWDKESLQKLIQQQETIGQNFEYDSAFGPDVEASLKNFLKVEGRLAEFNIRASINHVLTKEARDANKLIQIIKQDLM